MIRKRETMQFGSLIQRPRHVSVMAVLVCLGSLVIGSAAALAAALAPLH